MDKFEAKVKGRIGPGKGDGKVVRVLNRMIEWTDAGIRYEADQRHAEIIITELGLVEGSKGVSTPGVATNQKESGEDEGELNEELRRAYRGLVARANYLAQDRADIQFAVKELSRGMSKPTEGNWKALKRLGRYLLGRTRCVILYTRQSRGDRGIFTQSDTDYAGCIKTRKSTSGGIIKLGHHVVKTWSTTQSVIALSSGEAEYYGLVKATSHSLGMQAIAKDMGIDVNIFVYTDSSAAKGIASRRGLGKMRHIEVNQLWLQDKVAEGIIKVIKIPGTGNQADILTKHVNAQTLGNHVGIMGLQISEDRHQLMPSTT